MVKRFAELGPRIASNEHDVLQGTLGSRGQVFGDWSYDAYVQAGNYDSTESQSGNVLRSRIHELTYAADGGLAACGGLRLFGPDSVSTECADYIAVGGTNRAGFDQTIAEVSFSGACGIAARRRSEAGAGPHVQARRILLPGGSDRLRDPR